MKEEGKVINSLMDFDLGAFFILESQESRWRDVVYMRKLVYTFSIGKHNKFLKQFKYNCD